MARQRTVLVTGATSGIGKDVAMTLAREGYRVFGTGRRAEPLAALAADCEGLPLETLLLDVTDDGSIAAAAAAVAQRTDGYGLDILINNAGYGIATPIELITDADLRGQMDTNVVGVVKISQAFIPAMRKRGNGTIINISSVVGLVTLPMQGIYCATKHAVESLSDAMRQELAPFGIRVVIVEPGAIQTAFGDTALGQKASYTAESTPYDSAFQAYEAMVKKTYRGAPGPEVISRAVSRLLRKSRPRARYLVPGSGRFLVWLFRLLPGWLLDRLLIGMLKLGPGSDTGQK
jgi:NAD(P)-dependent dehydrogenase (short-subunit alcohol dehydrogenase family)